jgi:hypothetical protein
MRQSDPTSPFHRVLEKQPFDPAGIAFEQSPRRRNQLPLMSWSGRFSPHRNAHFIPATHFHSGFLLSRNGQIDVGINFPCVQAGV